MTQVAADVQLQVCGECLPDLYRLGAVHVPGPHAIALDTRCEAHGPIGALAAAHVVGVSPEILAQVDKANEAKAIAPLGGGDDAADASLVAQLAAALMPRDVNPSDDAISVYVRVARRVLAAARGK